MKEPMPFSKFNNIFQIILDLEFMLIFQHKWKILHQDIKAYVDVVLVSLGMKSLNGYF